MLLSVFTLIYTICPRICSKSRPKGTKNPLPVGVCRPKMSLLKLPDGGKGETAKQGNHQRIRLFTPGLQNTLSLTSDALNLT